MGRVSGKSPGSYVTGLVYLQKNLIVAQGGKPSPGMKVLDLAAASRWQINSTGSLSGRGGATVSNEISKQTGSRFW